MQKVQGADKINKFKSLEGGDAANTLQRNATSNGGDASRVGKNEH
jgi:hypothetical protein